MDYRKATRKTFVEKIDIRHSKPGEPFHMDNLTPDEPAREMWTVWITTRSGLLPTTLSASIFYSEVEALEFTKMHPVGSEILEVVAANVGKPEQLRKYIERMMDEGGHFLGVGDIGDEESPLAFDILDDAGVRDKGYGVSQKVIDFLGKQRVGALKNMHGDNWCSAAAFEYCWLNLPHSSPAFVAAKYQFHYYITQDDFSAGYLWRDLENLVGGVEASAIKAKEMRTKAGAAGSERSAMARHARRSALMGSMADVVARNPDIVKLGHKAVATLAVSDSASKNPTLWRQGQGQIDEYVGEIRRGEAGAELQAKFQSLFPQKPPRRLS